jgi:hypothetical protein
VNCIKIEFFIRQYVLRGIMKYWRIKSGRRRTVADLEKAARYKDHVGVRLCIEDGVDINHRFTSGDTLLVYVIKNYYPIDIAQTIIDKGADVNQTGAYDETPLSWAAYTVRLPLVISLIEQHADINAVAMGKSVLDNAYIAPRSEDRSQIIAYLEQRGAIRHQRRRLSLSAWSDTDTDSDDDDTRRQCWLLENSSDGVAVAADCSICKDDNNTSQMSRMSCEHSFHSECLLQWVILQRKCPLCRSCIVQRACSE